MVSADHPLCTHWGFAFFRWSLPLVVMPFLTAERAEVFCVFSAFSAASAVQKLSDALINTVEGDYPFFPDDGNYGVRGED